MTGSDAGGGEGGFEDGGFEDGSFEDADGGGFDGGGFEDSDGGGGMAIREPGGRGYEGPSRTSQSSAPSLWGRFVSWSNEWILGGN
jgi:hypothetical protein